MNDVLPQYTGLTVNSVNYTYTAVKKPEDPFVVTLQNSSSTGQGFVFRNRDSWTGLPGNTITRTVPTDNIPINLWGRGEFLLEGQGSITNPSVFYGYRYDTCKLTPVTDTSCPNYRPPVQQVNLPQTESVLEFQRVQLASELELEQNRKFVLDQIPQRKTSTAVSRGSNLLLTQQAQALALRLEALNNVPSFATYSVAMPGGTYKEVVKLTDKVLPDSRNSRRLNQSQQRLHESLVNSQFNKTQNQGIQND